MAQQLDSAKRIAILVQGTEEYGVGQVAMNLAIELKRRGESPSVVALEPGDLIDRLSAEGIACHVINVPPLPRYVKSKWKTILAVFRQQFWLQTASRTLASCLKEIAADSLVVQWPAHVALAGKSARIADVRCYWMMPNVIRNSWPLGLNRRFYRQLCRRFRITPLPNSKFTGDSLGSGLGAEILYLGVDEACFHPRSANAFGRAELGLPNGAAVAGIFARVEPVKGQDLVWTAMIELIRQGNDLHLLLVGGPTDGDFADRLRDLAEKHQLATRLHFTGWTNEPQRYYAAIDFAINATLIPEGFGLSVVEAMLMGKPVLVHALGGPAETVVDGATGWHVPEATVDAFVAGLRRALQDRARWTEMGAAARLQAIENFTVSKFVSGFLKTIGHKSEQGGSPHGQAAGKLP